MKHLARRGRLSVTLVALATFVSWAVQRSSPHVGLTILNVIYADGLALGAAMVIAEYRPFDRLVRRLSKPKSRRLA